MDIEALVKKHSAGMWLHERRVRAALTELAAEYEERLNKIQSNDLMAERVPACRGRNCGATDGISHSQECRNEHDAACGYAICPAAAEEGEGEMNDKMREAVLQILHSYKQEMERYNYYGSNPGASVDDFDDIANEIVAWQAAQAVPVVGEVVAWLHDAKTESNVITDSVKKLLLRCYGDATAASAFATPLIIQPTISISAAELDLMRQWFDCVQDVNGGFLNPDDFILAKKLYEIIGMRVPNSIIDAAIAGEKK